MDSIDNPDSAVTLECGHAFHGSCIVQHVARNPTCPMCRFDMNPYSDSDSELDSEDAAEDWRYISMSSVRQMAKDLKATNPQIKKRLDLIRKWKSQTSDNFKTISGINNKLRPAEDEIYKRLDLAESKMFAAYARKFSKEISERNQCRKRLSICRSRRRAHEKILIELVRAASGRDSVGGSLYTD